MVLFRQIGDRIKTAAPPWRATPETRQRQPHSPPWTVLLDGLFGIVRAGREITALASGKCGQRIAIKDDRSLEYGFYERLSEFHAFTVFSQDDPILPLRPSNRDARRRHS